MNDLELVENTELELTTQLSATNHVLELPCSRSGCRTTEVGFSDLHVWLDLAHSVIA
ncbi:hypothetical protein [Pseudoxanthomonas sp.]|uniref:hypothetical protein n=1 Tax=Pseudoxanthomonas sp. TaxID=1871049 RepID=UPI0025F649E5|nr:hypothetical protein [Pseudoxanthomonas sp.]